MIQAINGGKHVHDENVEYLKTKKLTIEMLGKNAQPFRINLDGEYGGDTPVELEVFHNHLEFFCEYWWNQQRCIGSYIWRIKNK